MADWLIEQGIGEERAILVEGGDAIAAHVRWLGELSVGQVEDGVLVARTKGAKRGRARFASGEEALVDRLPREASEGASIRLEVIRARIGEGSRVKLAHARPTQADPCPAPTLAEQLGGRIVRRFPRGCWEDICAEARDGIVDFSGGSLHFSPTPAMTLVDVDGTLPPRELALAAVDPLARSIARFGLGGVIGVDFPTLQAKDERKAVDVALAGALADYDHERTAMNGFGFVQIVARLVRPSILHRFQHDPSGAAARHLLCLGELVEDPGAVLLTAHPAVIARLTEDWLAKLARRTGRDVRMKADAGLALQSCFAQAVAA